LRARLEARRREREQFPAVRRKPHPVANRTAALQVSGAAAELGKQAKMLGAEVESFLARIRAA